MSSSINHSNQTVSGIKWSLLNQLVNQVLKFAVGIFLMRLLAPEDFGLMGMVTIIISFLNIFNDFGINSSIIQKKDITQQDKDTVFWMGLLLSFILGALLFASGPFIGEFYNESQLSLISKVLAVSFIFRGIGAMNLALLNKTLQFKKLFIGNATAISLASITAFILAYHGFGVWSLIFQSMITALITNLLAFYFSNYRPKFYFSRALLKEHLKFGLPLFGTKNFTYWTGNLDKLLIGKVLGASDLGLYSRAFSIITLPTRQITMVFTNVMFSSFALIQDDHQRIKNMVLKINRLISFMIFPLMGVLFIAAKPFVLFMFGEKWIDIIPLIQLFAIGASAKTLYILRGNVLLSQGESSKEFKVVVMIGVGMIMAFAISIYFGIYAVAVAYLLITILGVLPSFSMINKIIDIKGFALFQNVKVPLLSFVGLNIIGLFLINGLSTLLSPVNQLIVAGTGYFLFWILIYYLFEKVTLLESVQAFRKLVKR